jgi:hypothetical protein
MFSEEEWFTYLDEPMQDLISLSWYLLDREEMMTEGLYDYSFVVFPAAKAYEGFLKKFLWDLGLIGKEDWESDRFRIGRSLNPEVPRDLRTGNWIHDDLKKLCDKYKKEGEECLVDVIWKAWKKGRNKIFHYFGGDMEALDLIEARDRLSQIKEAMMLASEYRKRIKG